MKVLIINGSPKGDGSNTLRLTNAFVDGMCEIGDLEIKKLNTSSLDIRPCLGCFHCWKDTHGNCVIDDEMNEVIKDYLWADVILWSFPLYYFSVPGQLKNLIDRQLPMSLPFMTENKTGIGSGAHPSRYEISYKRHVLISTCGFYSTIGNYSSVLSMYDHILGPNNYETIFCAQGELFRVKELSSRTDEYLSYVKSAGFEYLNGKITPATREHLSELLYPKEVYEKMANASWGIEIEGENGEGPLALSFTQQMAALYNPSSYDGKTRILELNYPNAS